MSVYVPEINPKDYSSLTPCELAVLLKLPVVLGLVNSLQMKEAISRFKPGVGSRLTNVCLVRHFDVLDECRCIMLRNPDLDWSPFLPPCPRIGLPFIYPYGDPGYYRCSSDLFLEVSFSHYLADELSAYNYCLKNGVLWTAWDKTIDAEYEPVSDPVVELPADDKECEYDDDGFLIGPPQYGERLPRHMLPEVEITVKSCRGEEYHCRVCSLLRPNENSEECWCPFVRQFLEEVKVGRSVRGVVFRFEDLQEVEI